jgi:hypothetical protein
MVIDTLQHASEIDGLLLKKLLTSWTKEMADIETAIAIMDKYSSLYRWIYIQILYYT